MPRRRKTRVAATHKKTAALPAGDEGGDLSQDERVNKVETFVSDFDTLLEHHIEEAKKDFKRSLDALDHAFKVQCTYLKPLLNLPLHNFLKGPDGLDDALKAVDVGADDIESMVNAQFNLAVATKQRTKKNEMDTIAEEEGDDQPAETAKQTTRRTRRGAATTRKGTARKGSKFTTPYGAKASIAGIADTPLFTPQFNPRLPKTPAVTSKTTTRSILTVSDSGSPHPLAANEIAIGFGADKALKLREDQDLTAFVDLSDQDIVQKLSCLYQKLQNVFSGQKQ